MFRAYLQPIDTALDVSALATSLANQPFFFRSLTETSEDMEYYVTPHAYIPAFSISPDNLTHFEAAAYENLSATVRNFLKWDGGRTPVGWPNYTNYEKLEFFGFWFKRTLTEISRILLTEREVWTKFFVNNFLL